MRRISFQALIVLGVAALAAACTSGIDATASRSGPAAPQAAVSVPPTPKPAASPVVAERVVTMQKELGALELRLLEGGTPDAAAIAALERLKEKISRLQEVLARGGVDPLELETMMADIGHQMQVLEALIAPDAPPPVAPSPSPVTVPSALTLAVTVSGLAAGGSLTLREERSTTTLAFTTDATQSFAASFAPGASYAVSLGNAPASQECTIGPAAAGTLTSPLTLSVSCVTRSYTLAVAVSGLAPGRAITVRETGIGAEHDLVFDAPATKMYAPRLEHGASYAVVIVAQPAGQNCSVSAGSGTAEGNASASVTCVMNTYPLSIEVTGLTRGALVVRDAGLGAAGDLTFTGDGIQAFATRFVHEGTHAVTIVSQPESLSCSVTGGAGSVSGPKTVAVACTPRPPELVAAPAFGVSYFLTGAIAPSDPATAYVESITGTIYRTSDGGASWTVMCRNPHYYRIFSQPYMGIVISPAADKRAYVVMWGNAYRIDALAGDDCPEITPAAAGQVLAIIGRPNLAIDSTGALYITGHSSSTLFKSTDFGATWAALASGFANSFDVSIDPYDDSRILLSPLYGGNGIYRSVNGGVSFSHVTDTGFDSGAVRVLFDPARVGHVYANSGYKSSDGGASWGPSAAHAASQLALFHVRQDGVGFRLRAAGATTEVQTAPDMRTPVWTTLAGGALPLAATGQQLLNATVDAQGSNVLVVLRNRLYFSSNGGAAFTQLSLQKTPRDSIAAISSTDGQTLYGMNRHGHVFRSTDAGASWAIRADMGRPIFPQGSIIGFSHPTDPERVIFRPYQIGNYPEDAVTTANGFATFTQYSGWCCGPFWGWSQTIGQSPAAPAVAYVMGANFNRSNDSGATFTAGFNPPDTFVWYPLRRAMVSSVDPNRAWYAETSGKITEYDYAGATVSDVSARAPFGLAAWEQYKIGTSYFIRGIGQTGKVAVSSDDLQTLTPLADPEPALPSCSLRLLASLASDRNVLVTACEGDTSVQISRDGGAAWTILDLGSFSCSTSGLAVTAAKVYVSCYDDRAYAAYY